MAGLCWRRVSAPILTEVVQQAAKQLIFCWNIHLKSERCINTKVRVHAVSCRHFHLPDSVPVHAPDPLLPALHRSCAFRTASWVGSILPFLGDQQPVPQPEEEGGVLWPHHLLS